MCLSAKDTAARRVLGSNCKCVQIPTMQPGDSVKRLKGVVVSRSVLVVLRVDDVFHSALCTQVPAHCNFIVVAACHRGHTSRGTDN